MSTLVLSACYKYSKMLAFNYWTEGRRKIINLVIVDINKEHEREIKFQKSKSNLY